MVDSKLIRQLLGPFVRVIEVISGRPDVVGVSKPGLLPCFHGASKIVP